MRPGCDRDAAARLTYDTVVCQVWLDDLAERTGRNQEICSLHAQRLTVPRGWMLSDRRAEEPALFVPEPGAEPPSRSTPSRPGGRTGRRRSSSSSHPAAQTMELFEVLRQELAEAEAEPAPEPAHEPAPEPVGDELPAALKATSPLLSRAFATTGHQRSVLTQRGPADPDAGGDGAGA